LRMSSSSSIRKGIVFNEGLPVSRTSEIFAGRQLVDISDNDKESSYDGVLLIASESLNEKVLSQIVKVLKPGGFVVLQEPILTNGHKSNLRTEKDLFLALTIAGFVDVKKVSITQTGDNHIIELSASKPDWELGAASAIKLPLKSKAADSEAKKPAVWTLSADDVDEADLEDEDALLDDIDLKVPLQKKKDDCEVGKGGQRKAC